MKWIPFFKTGVQTDSLGREKIWTSEEVDKSVNNYNKLKQEDKRPIVIGHPNNNLPIVGFIEKVKRVGDTLYALPGKVSVSFKELVKDGKFPNRSISFNKDGSINHFGFLPVGIEPAVKDLGKFEFSDSNNNNQNYNFNGIIEDEEPYEENGDLLRIEAELEIINKQIEELLTNGKQNIKTDNELAKIIEKQNSEIEKQSFNNKLERYAEKGIITPALKSKYLELTDLLNEKTNNYSANKQNVYALLDEIINLSENVINFNEIITKPNKNVIQDEISLIANTYKL